jgi:hypothetical protein
MSGTLKQTDGLSLEEKRALLAQLLRKKADKANLRVHILGEVPALGTGWPSRGRNGCTRKVSQSPCWRCSGPTPQVSQRTVMGPKSRHTQSPVSFGKPWAPGTSRAADRRSGEGEDRQDEYQNEPQKDGPSV